MGGGGGGGGGGAWVDVLEQDHQACYDAVRIAGSVLNTKS